MPRLHHHLPLILVSLILASPGPALQASAQAPPAVVQPATPPKPSPAVQAILDIGHKARLARPPRLDEAQQRYTEALQEARTRQDKPGESFALRNLGNVASLRKEPARALDFYQQSIAVCRENNDLHGQADSLNNIALLFVASAPDKALETGEQARQFYHDSGDRKNEGQTFSFLGKLLARQGQKERARTCYDQAIVLARASGDIKGEADALWYIGTLIWTDKAARANDMQVITGAKTYFQQALPLYHAIHDVDDEALTADLIGDIFISEGDLDQSRLNYKQALSLYRSVNDQPSIAGLLRQLATATFLEGRFLESLQYDQEALETYRQLGEKARVAVELMHIGTLYDNLGQPATSIRYFLDALPLLEQSNDLSGQAEALTHLVFFSERSGDHKASHAYLSRLIPLLNRPVSGIERFQNMYTLADVYYYTKDYTRAQDLVEKLLKDAEQTGSAVQMTSTLGFLGGIQMDLGHPDKALDYYRRELQLFDDFASVSAKASVLEAIADIEEKQSDLAHAETHLRESVALLETVRGSLGGLTDAKSSYLNRTIGIYRRYLSLLLRRGKKQEAFALAQKMKARALLDLLFDGKVQMAASLTPEERQQEKMLRQKSDALNSLLVKEGVQNEIGSKKRAEAIKVQLADTERDLQALEDRLYARHPDLALKRAASTARLEDAAKFLPADSALLEYITLTVGKVDELVLFVVTKSAGVPVLSVHTVPIRQQDLRLRVDALRESCSDPRKDYRSAAAALYKILISPAERQIAGKRRLIVCPDGALWDAPFAALLADNSASPGKTASSRAFLIERFEVDYAYSATGAGAAFAVRTDGKRRQPSRTMLVFADPSFGDEQRFGDSPELPGQRPIAAASRPIAAPSRPTGTADRPIAAPSRPIAAPSRPIAAPSRDLFLPRGGYLSQLPGTELEARAIKTDFKDAAIFTGDAAQEATAKREAGMYRYLHFATHGFFNDTAPLLSAVVLALPDKNSGEDGFLTAREIFDLDLSAELVVLSACNTARGEKRSGEGIIGLTWALFAAGAPTQVVSQWSVNDASTALLMKNFYFNLTQMRLQKGEALRQAALSLMKATGSTQRRLSTGNPKSTGGKYHAATQHPEWTHPYYWAPFILLGDWR